MSKAEMIPASCVRASAVPRIGVSEEDLEPITLRPGELREAPNSDSDRKILPSDIAELRRWGLT